MILEGESLTILTLLPAARFGQILEVPLQSIDVLRFTLHIKKEEALFGIIDIQFKKVLKNPILLDGKEIELSNSSLRLCPQQSKSFQGSLSKISTRPKIELVTVLMGINGPRSDFIPRTTSYSSVCEIEVRRALGSVRKSSPEKIVCTRNFNQKPIEDAAPTLPFHDKLIEMTDKAHDTMKQDDELLVKDGRPQRQFRTIREKSGFKPKVIKPKAKQPLITSRRSTNLFQERNSKPAQSELKQPYKIPDKNSLQKDMSRDSLQNQNPIISDKVIPPDSKIWHTHLESQYTSNLPGNRNECLIGKTKIEVQGTEKATVKRPLLVKRKVGTRASMRITRKSESIKPASGAHARTQRQTKGQKISAITGNKQSLLLKGPTHRVEELSTSPQVSGKQTEQSDLKLKFCSDLPQESSSKTLPCKTNDRGPGSPTTDEMLQQNTRLPRLATKYINSQLNSPDYYNTSSKDLYKFVEGYHKKVEPVVLVISTPQPPENPIQCSINNEILVNRLGFMSDKMKENESPYTYISKKGSHAQHAVQKLGTYEPESNNVCQFKLKDNTVELEHKEDSCTKPQSPHEPPKRDHIIHPVWGSSVAKIEPQGAVEAENSAKEEVIPMFVDQGANLAPKPSHTIVSFPFSSSQKNNSSEADDEILSTSESELGLLDSIKKRRTDHSGDTRPEKKRMNKFKSSLSPTQNFIELSKHAGSSMDKKAINQQKSLENEQNLDLMRVFYQSQWQREETKAQQKEIVDHDKNKDISIPQKSVSYKDQKSLNADVAQNLPAVSLGLRDEEEDKNSTSKDLDKKLETEKKLQWCTSFDKRAVSEQRDEVDPVLGTKRLPSKISLDDKSGQEKAYKDVGIHSSNPLSINREYAAEDLMVRNIPSVSGIRERAVCESATSSLGMNSSPNKKTLGSISRFFEQPAGSISERRQICQGPTVTASGSPIGKGTHEKDYMQEPAPRLKKRAETYQKHFKNTSQDEKACGALGPSPSAQMGLKLGQSSSLVDKTGLVLHETTDGVHYRDVNSHEVITQKTIQDPFCIRDSQLPIESPLLASSGARGNKLPADKVDDLDLRTCFQPFSRSNKPLTGELDRNGLPNDLQSNIQKNSEKWNMTIRTRYGGVYDTVHRIADVSRAFFLSFVEITAKKTRGSYYSACRRRGPYEATG